MTADRLAVLMTHDWSFFDKPAKTEASLVTLNTG